MSKAKDDLVREPTKTELKLIHTLVEHLFAEVLHHLTAAENELAKIVKKKGDERAETVLDAVISARQVLANAIEKVQPDITGMPTLKQLEEFMEALVMEAQMAKALTTLTETEAVALKMQ